MRRIQIAVFMLLLLTARVASASDSITLTDDEREQCLKVLRAGFTSTEFWPSIHAAEALTLAGLGKEVRTALLPVLAQERDSQRRCGLAREIVRAGDRSAAQVMLDILVEADDYGHTHAAESLYKVGVIGDGQRLRRRFLRRGNVTLQIMAAAALGKSGNPRAMVFLREQLENQDPNLSRIAAWVLARIGHPSDTPRLKAGLERAPDEITRCYFQNALAAQGDEMGRAALVRNLADRDAAIRTYSAVFAGDARVLEAAEPLKKLLRDETLDVRIRAAQSLIVLSQPPAAVDHGDDVARIVYEATEQHPRYSEGSIAVLPDGRLLYATTEFSGSAADAASAQIVARESADGGRTWGDSRVLQRQTGRQNVMSVSMTKLGGPLDPKAPWGMFYLKKNSPVDLQVMLRTTEDGGRTFGSPIRVTQEAGYHVMNNDRVVRLSNGRLLAPVAATPDLKNSNHFKAYCYLSDDDGRTWRRGSGLVDLPKRGAMEPEVIEHPGGRVTMIVRTQLGYIAMARSVDGGDSWSEPSSWRVRAPEAPATLRRIPSSGDLLLIWNDTYEAGQGHGGKRTPLTAAISEDEGLSWKYKRSLETSPEQTFAYTSLTFQGNRAALSYYVRDEASGRISSKFRSLPIAWFYQNDPQPADPTSDPAAR